MKLVEVLRTINTHEVVRGNHVEAAKFLLSFKETDRSFESDVPLLHCAVMKQNLEMVKVVLSDPCLGKDERKDCFRLRSEYWYAMTPLELAIKHDYQQIIEVSKP